MIQNALEELVKILEKPMKPDEFENDSLFCWSNNVQLRAFRKLQEKETKTGKRHARHREKAIEGEQILFEEKMTSRRQQINNGEFPGTAGTAEKASLSKGKEKTQKADKKAKSRFQKAPKAESYPGS